MNLPFFSRQQSTVETNPLEIQAKFVAGLQHCDAIPRLIKMLRSSIFDDELAGPGPVFIGFAFMRTHERSTNSLYAELSDAAQNLLRYYDIVSASLIGTSIALTPGANDLPEDRAWLATSATELLPKERQPYKAYDDAIRGSVGAFSLINGVVGLKGTDEVPVGSFVGARLARVTYRGSQRMVQPEGSFIITDNAKSLSGRSKRLVIDEERESMLTRLGVAEALGTTNGRIVDAYKEGQKQRRELMRKR